MFVETYGADVERALVQLVEAFQQTPDLWLHEQDLYAHALALLREQPAFAKLYPTRDGRLTSLVHRRYPSLLAFADGLAEGAPPDEHPLAVLDPRFVRSHPWALVRNLEGQGAQALRAEAAAPASAPLLAVVHLVLTEDLTDRAEEAIRGAFYALVRAEPDAQRQYLAVLIRHWDLEHQIGRVIERLAGWAALHTQVSAVVVQSFRDDIGRVFGGRYLNLWSHTAALPPLDVPPPQSSRTGVVYPYR